MPKIKNLANGPVSVYCGGISMAVPPGEFLESDGFTDAELKFYRAHPDQFEVVGDAVEGAGNAEALKTVTAERDEARAKLAEIVALFDSADVDELNVKAAVERLIQDAGEIKTPKPVDPAAMSAVGDRITKTRENSNQPTDLAAAIALLDDANDEHWTQAGLPDISTLKTLTGGDVTRAQVDQLPEGDKRVRKV